MKVESTRIVYYNDWFSRSLPVCTKFSIAYSMQCIEFDFFPVVKPDPDPRFSGGRSGAVDDVREDLE